MHPDMHSISFSKNSLIQPVSEVNSEISPQCNVRANGICARKEVFQIFSHERDLIRTRILSPGFLGHAIRRLPAVKKVGRQRAKTIPTAGPDFRPLLLLKRNRRRQQAESIGV